MSVYYQDDLVTLHHGDCREIADWLEADVLLTDPPYGIGYYSHRKRGGDGRRIRGKSGQEVNGVRGDLSVEMRDEALAMWGTQRPALVFGRWDAPRPAGVRARLVWWKTPSPGSGDHTFPFGCSDEEVYVLGTWPPVVPGGRAREGGRPGRRGSVFRMDTYNSQSSCRPAHPTPKPPPVMEYLLESCPPGVVADPFAGSGPALIAAKLQGRRAIGVELEERYCEIAARRLAQDALPFGEAS